MEHGPLKFCCAYCLMEYKQLKHLVEHWESVHRKEYEMKGLSPVPEGLLLDSLYNKYRANLKSLDNKH